MSGTEWLGATFPLILTEVYDYMIHHQKVSFNEAFEIIDPAIYEMWVDGLY